MVGLKQPRPVHLAIPARPLTVALVGIGGYGDVYLRSLLTAEAGRRPVRLVSAVDPYAASSPRLGELSDRNVPIFSSVDEMYARSDAAPDLVVLASPIALHAEQTIRALERGSHVLCEKPLSATVDQARQMMAARDRADRVVGIGYQWSFSEPIQNLKRDVRSGLFGKPKRLRTLVLWPRDEQYYTRNNWVGRRFDPTTGAPVFDSPVNNACAHFLHNMLYVLGEQVDRSAAPHGVTAELYRANAIENYDTAAIRCMTRSGAELLFYVSHAIRDAAGPLLEYEFERATVRCEGDAGEIVAELSDGTVINYGMPASSVDISKLWRTAYAIENNTPIECGIEASLAQTQVMCAAQESPESIVEFPSQLIRTDAAGATRRLYVEGLGETLQRCFDGRLPSELGISWANAARETFTYDC
jgi:predicted dehydrogenase